MISHTSYTILHFTAAHVDMVSGAARLLMAAWFMVTGDKVQGGP